MLKILKSLKSDETEQNFVINCNFLVKNLRKFIKKMFENNKIT